MIFIGLILQAILHLTLKNNKAIAIISVGCIAALLNFFDFFKQFYLFKLSLTANIIYLIISSVFLVEQLRDKKVQPHNFMLFSLIFGVMNSHLIAISSLIALIINNIAGFSERSNSILRAICLLIIAEYYFPALNINFILPFLILCFFAIFHIIQFDHTSFSYFSAISFVALEDHKIFLYILISSTFLLLIAREIISNKKANIIRNNFFDKILILFLVGKTKGSSLKINKIVPIERKATKSRTSLTDIVNKEENLDLLFLLLGVISLLYLGVMYGNI